MLLSLCLSLTGLIFTGVQPLAKPVPALPVGPVPVSLVGLDVRTDFLAQGWPLPSPLSALLASPQPAIESGHSLTKAMRPDGQPEAETAMRYTVGLFKLVEDRSLSQLSPSRSNQLQWVFIG